MAFFNLKFIQMIYKFTSEDNESNIEVSKQGKLLCINTHSRSSEILFSKEGLYDLIGALHSIQTKIKREGENESN